MTPQETQPRRILIADDDIVSRRLLQSFLEKWGFEVVAADDGEDALRILEKPNAPTLAILDWMMPRKDGLQVCTSVRARPGRAYVYILLLTARTRKDDLLQGLESGADDYLTKPFHAAELRARLQVGQRILELQTGLIQAREELLFRATHDELTGLVNRRVIIEAIAREHSRHTRHGGTFAVIVLDLDHFKRVNDTHGHLAGDAVLKEVARRMAVGLRPYDTVGRYGGEEFVIVAPSCDREGASRLVERILTMIRSKAVDATECHVSVTASCGISISNPGKPLDPRDLMRMADEALYRAKDHGRNRAEFAVEPELIGSS
jgi:two-component system cell cycle response regulator